ncbi:MAG: helix-turn-helix domain-containing protein, partial [Nitrospirae bacterium]
RKGFLQPEEIKKIREQYGLSQRNFARLLGWGEITIHRYESGAIQDDVHNDVLALIKDVDDFKKLFESKKNNIEPALARKVEEWLIEIEKEKNRQTVDLLVRIFSFKNTSKSASIGSAVTPTYLAHSDALKYCANEELALAA